ncbi:MAG: glycerophosphodiester phosphodiesterase [Syntrophothermus sp.]
MKRMTKILLLPFILSVMILCSCNTKPGAFEPIDSAGIINNANPLPENIRPQLEGIYKITEGNSDFGNYAVVKLIRNHLSVLCSGNNSYFILSSGERDSSLMFDGFWRYSQNTTTGTADLTINKFEGARNLLSGRPAEEIILKGVYSKDGRSGLPLKFQYVKPLKNDSSFYIIAHRGGGRNSDHLPASENSLEILQLAEYYGANSVEIDVQLTKDNIPILFHDEEFTQRLVKGNYLIGSVSSFSFKQIRTFGRLIHDEKIPSLEEALDVILNKTSVKLVWLDVKYPSSIPFVAPLQKKYNELALARNRNLKILIGLPDEDVLNSYLQYGNTQEHPCLCELDITQVRKAGAGVWAPRFTDGIVKPQILSMQTEQRKVFVWTLDNPGFIHDFVSSKYYDGILSNYPSIVACEYYMREE